MARRYGSNSSSSTCFNSYVGYSSYTIADYACTVVFLAVYLSTLITLCVVRRKAGAGKHLIGLPYTLALFFMFIQQIYNFIMSTLSACRALHDVKAVYDTNIASLVFYWIHTMLLLFVVIYTLNIMLRRQLDQNLSVLKVVFGIDMLILGVLLLAYIATLSYTYYWMGRSHYRLRLDQLASMYISLSFDAFFMLSIISSGILSLLAAASLKEKSMARSSLLVWISVLIISLFVYVLISIIITTGQISYGAYLGEAAYTAMDWISAIVRALAFIIIIVIARNPVWASNAFAEDAVQQQYAYNYQQEAPIYDGAQRAQAHTVLYSRS